MPESNREFHPYERTVSGVDRDRVPYIASARHAHHLLHFFNFFVTRGQVHPSIRNKSRQPNGETVIRRRIFTPSDRNCVQTRAVRRSIARERATPSRYGPGAFTNRYTSSASGRFLRGQGGVMI